mmetsp:Transcript_49175/g.149207  ORF Transcript_49175/g.149207 Transcript_49175/m.149207 type:complete len:229 (-) Transcript_49175:87-773(-)
MASTALCNSPCNAKRAPGAAKRSQVGAQAACASRSMSDHSAARLTLAPGGQQFLRHGIRCMSNEGTGCGRFGMRQSLRGTCLLPVRGSGVGTGRGVRGTQHLCLRGPRISVRHETGHGLRGMLNLLVAGARLQDLSLFGRGTGVRRGALLGASIVLSLLLRYCCRPRFPQLVHALLEGASREAGIASQWPCKANASHPWRQLLVGERCQVAGVWRGRQWHCRPVARHS